MITASSLCRHLWCLYFTAQTVAINKSKKNETTVDYFRFGTKCQQPALCNMFPTDCSLPSKFPLIFGLIVAAMFVLLMCCLAEAEPVLLVSSCQYPGQGIYMLQYSDFSWSSPGNKSVFSQNKKKSVSWILHKKTLRYLKSTIITDVLKSQTKRSQWVNERLVLESHSKVSISSDQADFQISSFY